MKRILHQGGQATVEFALVVPLLLLLIFGVLDFGRAFNIKNDATHLANQAVRYAAVGTCSACSPNTIATYIQGQAVDTGTTVTFCFPNGQSSSSMGNPIKATVKKTYNFLGFLSFFGISATANITGSSTMRLESDWNQADPSSGNNLYSSKPPGC